MEILTNWLKEIIIVILLAVFLDMTLPNSTMQRYVKFVMGLFILITILSPILNLLNQDLSLQNIPISMSSNAEVNGEREMIREHSEQLMKWQEEQSNKYVEDQLAILVKQKIESAYPIDVKQVKVKTSFSGELNQSSLESIVSIEVFVESPDNKRPEQTKEVAAVSSIEPIQIDEIKIDEQDQRDQGKDTIREEEEKKYETLLMQIEREIEQTWELSPDQVKAYYMTG